MVELPVGPDSSPLSTFSQIVRPRVSPALIVSVVSCGAVSKLLENPSAGTTAVARVTRSFTSMTKASPEFCTEPSKISRLFGPV